MKKSTRLFGALLALVFVLALLPVSAFAAEPTAPTEPAKPEFVVTEGMRGMLKNVAGMEYKVGENGQYTAVPDGTSEVELTFSGFDVTYTVYVRPVGGGEETKIVVERQPNPYDIYVKEVVPTTTKGGSDGKIIFNQRVRLEYGPGVGDMEIIETDAITGLKAGIYYIASPAADNKLASVVQAINVADYNPVTVTFNPGDHGTGEMEPITVQKGYNFEVPECTFTPVADSENNYEFAGWDTDPNIVKFEDGKCSVQTDTEFTAKWNAVPKTSVTVTFAPGDHGEGEMEPITAEVNTAIDAPECKFTPVADGETKYEFDGWATDEHIEVTEDGKFIVKNNTVLTAKWKEVKEPVMKDITLTYDYNDGSGKGSSETKTVEEGTNAQFVLPQAPYQRDEHEFQGWEIAGNVYKAGETVYNSVDATAKAVWKERKALHYVLRFDANGGTGAPEAQDMGMSKRREVRLTVTDKVPTKDGMKFLGWSLHKGTEVVLQPGSVCLLNEKFPDLTVYAVWADPASAPKTGDESNAALWAGIAAVSLIVVAGAVFFILKKNKKKDDEDQIDTQE